MLPIKHLLPGLLLLSAGLIIVKPLASTPDSGKPTVVKWAIQKTSTLRILGQSNVNSFGCDIKGFFQPDTIYCSDMPEGRAVPLRGAVKITVASFNCHNELITNDLRKTLKASQYPYLVIRFLSLERFPDLQNMRDCIKGCVEIELAGKCKQFQLNYSFVNSGSCMQLNGSKNFCFSDFDLSPPKKLAGLIKVKDDFNVQFQLLLTPCN